MSGSGGSWKVAYADFMTALMAFFLLMWIISMVPPDKKQELAAYFSDPGSYAAPSATSPIVTTPPLKDNIQPYMSEDALIELPRFLAERLQLTQIIVGSFDPATGKPDILLRAGTTVTFPSENADLDELGRDLLNSAIQVMQLKPFRVVLRGHTDKVENGGEHFKSKWELSSARSSAVAEYLIDQGKIEAERITVVSYADTRPLSGENSEKTPHAERAVELFFYSPNADMTKLGF